MSDFSRRTIVRGTAWSVPVVAIAAHAPAFAASAPPIKLTYVEAIKCSGNSDPKDPKTYVFVFTADSVPAQGSVSSSTITINGDVFQVEKVVVDGTTVYVQTVSSTKSPNASGTLTISYTSGMPPVTQSLPFPYSGTNPDHGICAIV
jgi:hypothetical protein